MPGPPLDDGRQLQKLYGALDYDPPTSADRTRLDVALMLHSFAHVRFDDELQPAA